MIRAVIRTERRGTAEGSGRAVFRPVRPRNGSRDGFDAERRRSPFRDGTLQIRGFHETINQKLSTFDEKFNRFGQN